MDLTIFRQICDSENSLTELIILTILTNFSKIRQGEISWADLTILKNFRHFGYCMHFWTLCFMQFAVFFISSSYRLLVIFSYVLIGC